ncbi:N-ethylmaleimide reductase [Chitinophaga ginsengisegetis]|uniref:N-ethylmaleimide reductase n=1 Tax=Chitinophaga ginsengisegetis TaxID=393003 RepID=A0A1T5PC53_9BACT|nr:alkene reductase [Chitinophaga ginsengisegetis]SKD10334.1 N-ethylmaleimide reductase [Chitinophaga ginsengisegetis]
MKLLEPVASNTFTLNNRIVMAPMSRRRATNGVPDDMVATYYSQRAGAGLIIAESTAISPNGVGYYRLPGIYNNEQIAAWKKVTDAVHEKGGTIFLQLLHSGRIGHPLNLPGGGPLLAPSAIAANGSITTVQGPMPMPVPEAMSTTAVEEMIGLHLKAAENTIAAGFDGIEVHAAHGYLIEQFMHPHTNRRTDKYGGNIENRNRFLLEIVQGTIDIAGAHRVGIRFSPFAAHNSLPLYDEEIATHLYLIPKLNQMDIRYIHLSDQSTNGSLPIPSNYIGLLRQQFKNWLILAGGFTADSAEKTLQRNEADLIAFGRPFISNPDLPERFRHQHPLAPGDKSTFYQGGAAGLIDYPCMNILQ